ncbi:MAG TPA: type II secretion system F family protein [Burkholderiales bacterium]|nr:type II secretion system F family protein [Burkholderiales bacterium]
MRFQLKAVGQDGRVEALDLEAFDQGAAVQQAEGRGYTVLSVRRRALAWRRGARFPVALFSQELLVLLQAGLPLVDSIETLAQKEQRAGRSTEVGAALERILATLRQGRPFSAALEQSPQAFPPLYIATVRASERTSDLPAALARYVAYEQQLDAIRKRLVNASIYPALLIGVGALVSLFLLFYVVPRFSHIYEERAVDLPVFSKVLLGWGKVVEGNGAVVGVALLVVAALLFHVFRSASVRARLGDLLWKVPSVDERLKLYQLARFYRTTGMLLRGGMPLVAALDMGAGLLHPALRERLAAARRAITEGRPVAASLEEHGLTTPVALRMLAVGERSGNMGEMMDRAASFHDDEIARWIEWFTRLFEPILMAVIGLVIGAIVIMMYMPIFELAGNLQ